MIDQLLAIREVYRSLPSIACKGACWNSCGPIDMSTAERQRVADLGYEIPGFTEERSKRWADGEPLHCPALNRETLTCDVYEDRPLICRLWGVSASMPCEHGCPSTGTLTDDETYELLFKVMQIGGHPQLDTADGNRFRELLADPEVGPLMARFIRGDRSVEPEVKRLIQERQDNARSTHLL